MALIKARNKGGNLLFIDSLRLIMRPATAGNDNFILVDEEKTKNDPEFMKCVVLGSIEICPVDKEFPKPEVKSEEKREVISDKPVRKTSKKEKVKKEEKIRESKNETEIEEFIEPPEPKNSDPVVVVTGEKGKARTAKVKFFKQSDMPMPKFINEKDIHDMKDEDIDAESRVEKDIDLSKIEE